MAEPSPSHPSMNLLARFPVVFVGLGLLLNGYFKLSVIQAAPRYIVLSVLLFSALVASLLLLRKRDHAQLTLFFMVAAAAMLVMPLTWATLFAAGWVVLVRGKVTSLLFIALALLISLGAKFAETYGVSGDSLLAILQTDAGEMADFVLSNVGLRYGVMMVVLAGVLGLSMARPMLKWPWVGLAPALFGFAALAEIGQDVVLPARDFRAQLAQFKKLEPPVRAPVTAADLDVVFILGESNTRWHMGLYGYPYPTNPRLMQIRDHLVTLGDAVSSHSHTVPSVSSIMLRDRAGEDQVSQSLVGRLRSVGVVTRWFSSQSSQGPWDTPVRNVAKQSDQVEYFRNRTFSLPLGLEFELGVGAGFTADDDVIDRLLNDLKQGGQGPGFWLAHLTAGHADYCHHIPVAMRREMEGTPRGPRYFGNAPDRSHEVNCYDAALRQVDALLARVIDDVSQRARPTVVIFSPDHGEDPDAGTGHSSGQHSAKHIEIPVIVFFNEAAKRAQPQQLAHIEHNRNKPYFLPWMHETILDLYGVTKHFDADPRRALGSSEYSPGQRLVFGGEAPMDYDSGVRDARKDYLSRTRLNLAALRLVQDRPKLLFAHRNNSELALMEALPYFDGVEMDVVFDDSSQRFEIFHAPAQPVGYTLERALEISAHRPEMHFWFDWKNASEQNLPAAVRELQRLDQKFGIRQRALVETPPQFKVASGGLLTQAGFRHSHYLAPAPDTVVACMASVKSAACESAAAADAQAIVSTRSDCMSYDMRDSSFALAVRARTGTSCRLAWDLRNDAASLHLLESLGKPSDLEALIVPTKTRYLR